MVFPSVFQLSPSVFPLSPNCFPVVFQMLFPTRHLVVSRLSCRCGLSIVSQFVPDVLSRFSPNRLPLNPHKAQSLIFGHPINSQLLSNCSKLPPKCGLPIVFQLYPFEIFELESVNADGLQSWVNRVQLSGCLSLLVSVSLCLSLWLLVSDSPDFSCCRSCFQVSLHVSCSG